MAIKLSKLFNTTKNKNFWIDIVIGVILFIVAVMLMPFWLNVDVFFSNWGYLIIDVIVGVCLLLYIIFFLIKKAVKGVNNTIKILTIVELVILSLIALGSFFAQFKIINIGDASQILGVAFWLRGTIEIFSTYYQGKNSQKNQLLTLTLNILLITIGVFFAVSKVVNNTVALWVITFLLLLLGLMLICVGILKKPNKK